MTCAICAWDGEGVRDGLVHWHNRRPAWDFVPRCADRVACAERVKAAGKPWPVIERDHAKGYPTPEPPPPEPTGRDRRAEYDAWARRQAPDQVDPRPPRVDPAGNVTWPEPVTVAPIPDVAPRPPAPPRPPEPSNQGGWW